MKRFYKLVSKAKGEAGWSIQLDGKPVKTPLKKNLEVKAEGFADLLVCEWAGQSDEIDLQKMPYTQIASTLVDRVCDRVLRDQMKEALLKYLDTDLICYRAPPENIGAVESPAHLQAQIWDPWLDWFEKEYAERLQTTHALTALRQPQGAHDNVSGKVDALSDEEFTLFQLLVPATGSLVLSLAFMEHKIGAEDLLKAIRIEEHLKDHHYNAELYGRDPAQEKRDDALLVDLKAVENILKVL